MKNIEKRICPTCQKEYYKAPTCSKKSWDERYRVCSRKCRVITDEWKNKISLSRIGVTAKENHPQWKPESNRHNTEMIECICGCGELIRKYDSKGRIKKVKNGHQINLNKDALHSDKEALSERGKTLGKLDKAVKEEHWNWKGGITDVNRAIRTSTPYKEWRMSVLQRDRFSCVNCGYRSCKPKDIVVDHIKAFSLYPDLRLDLDNGRTLCRPCDKILGWNYNRDKT